MSESKGKFTFKRKTNNQNDRRGTPIQEKGISLNLKENLDNFIVSHLETELIQQMNPNTHELEFRIGEYVQKGFGPKSNTRFEAYVSRLKFNRMIKEYHDLYSTKGMEENISLDIVHDQNFRITVGGETLNNSKSEIEFFCKTNKLRKPQFMEKIQILKSDNPDWNYRLTSAEEKSISNKTQRLKLTQAVEDKTISKFYRYKYRYSYFVDPEVRIDFTIVKETPKGHQAGTLVSSRTLAQKEKYQVELEYTGSNFKADHLTQIVEPHLSHLIRLFNGSRGSDIPISQSYSNLVISKYLNMCLKDNGLGNKKLTLEMIRAKPSTTKFLAVDVEALTRQNFNRIRDDYMVTVKADGEHYLLYCDAELGFFLINNRLNVTPITLNEGSGNSIEQAEFRKNIAELGDCLYDGELVEYDGKFRFLIFDCFFFQGKDVRDFPLYQRSGDKYLINEKSRIYYIKKLTKLINNDILKKHLLIEEKRYDLTTKVGSRFFKKVDNSDDSGYVMNEENYPYNIDGLIYMPVNKPYPKVTMRGNQFIKINSMDDPEISPMLKWKPPQFLSIDFRVNFGKERKVEKINGQEYMIMTLESAYGSQIHPFEPTAYRVKDYNKLYMPLTNGQPQLIDRPGYRADPETLGHVIRNLDILEFVWIPDRSFGTDYYGIWFPIKYREDKTSNGYPNNYRKVADRTWMAIQDQQILPENLMDLYGRTFPTPQLDLGYYQNENRESLVNLREIHNSIKSILLFLAIKQSGSRSRRLMDLATGRGGDFMKWSGVNYVFGIEYDEANLKSGDRSAYSRYRMMMERSYRNNQRTPFSMDLIQGDMREPFSEGNISNEEAFNYILKDRLGGNKESFGIISCQFAMHYACDSEEHLDNFIRNISENLAPNGYFVATTFDGGKILNALQNTDKTDEDGKPVLIGKGSDGKIMWSISAPMKYRKLEEVGQKIMVFNKTIKDEEEVEYLVNFNYVLEVARKYDLYPASLASGKYTLPMDGSYGIGNFSDAYDQDFLQMVGESIYPKGSPKHKKLDDAFAKIPIDIKRYSQYSSYLILRKQ